MDLHSSEHWTVRGTGQDFLHHCAPLVSSRVHKKLIGGTRRV